MHSGSRWRPEENVHGNQIAWLDSSLVVLDGAGRLDGSAHIDTEPAMHAQDEQQDSAMVARRSSRATFFRGEQNAQQPWTDYAETAPTVILTTTGGSCLSSDGATLTVSVTQAPMPFVCTSQPEQIT